MTYEQFYFWLEGYLDSYNTLANEDAIESATSFLEKILEKMQDVKTKNKLTGLQQISSQFNAVPLNFT